jgi:hypothetical protein
MLDMIGMESRMAVRRDKRLKSTCLEQDPVMPRCDLGGRNTTFIIQRGVPRSEKEALSHNSVFMYLLLSYRTLEKK